MARLLFLILVVSLAGTGCCKDCVRSKPSSPKVEEYPLTLKPERLPGGII